MTTLWHGHRISTITLVRRPGSLPSDLAKELFTEEQSCGTGGNVYSC